MLEAARAAGIEPWVCLHHFVLPTWVAPAGVGFCDAHARDYHWRRHLEFIVEQYGDLVTAWKPINEPIAYAVNGFLAGVNPPGVRDFSRAMEALEGAHLANLIAWQVLRQTGKPVSTIHALSPIFAADDSPESAAVVRTLDDAVWSCWIRAIRDGVLALPGRAAIEVHGYVDAFDLVGFSYYSANAVTAGMEVRPYPPDGRVGPLGYVPWSPGIGMVLDRLTAELPHKPLLIAEHGVGGDDDELRCDVLAQSLQLVAQRLSQGQDIRGFFHWTSVDNYEWGFGRKTPFGLFDTDRKPRRSAELLHQVATTGRIATTSKPQASVSGGGR